MSKAFEKMRTGLCDARAYLDGDRDGFAVHEVEIHEPDVAAMTNSGRTAGHPATHPAREEVRTAVAGLRGLRRAVAMEREDQPALTADAIKSLIEEGRRQALPSS